MRRPTIGLEVHVQLQTASKMFCACPAEFGAEPNTNVCPVCLALPGSLPVINRKAVENTIALGLALHCRIAPFSQFHRKNYFYPDLPKGYQISQYDLPLAQDGYLTVETDRCRQRVGIVRVHMEEDTAKSIHGASIAHNVGYSLLDFNRGGVPLLEVVSAPDITSQEEASTYLLELRAILRTLGISSGNMEEGALRCDVNVSLEGGTRAEVKNLNSFRAVRRALEFEIQRQEEILNRGEAVTLETRHWDEATGTTIPGRSKEEAEDYRYFPEPDLVPLDVGETWVEEIRRGLPELPEERRARFTSFGLQPSQTVSIANDLPLSSFYDECLRMGAPAKETANWLLGDVQKHLNLKNRHINQVPITPATFCEFIGAVIDGTISAKTGKAVLEEMLMMPEQEPMKQGAKSPRAIIAEKGLAQVSDPGEIRTWAREAIARNSNQAEGFRKGKEALLGFFLGQVMNRSGGRANPEVLDRIMREELARDEQTPLVLES
jgi:aspartyl-tRNA(Asn)/glutamyl-tRNA(Gln) amidotransferase subunit B